MYVQKWRSTLRRTEDYTPGVEQELDVQRGNNRNKEGY